MAPDPTGFARPGGQPLGRVKWRLPLLGRSPGQLRSMQLARAASLPEHTATD